MLGGNAILILSVTTSAMRLGKGNLALDSCHVCLRNKLESLTTGLSCPHLAPS
jgi:hypothetical protein